MTDTNYPVELVDIEELIPYDKNVKIHDEKQIEHLANNIKKFGFDQPIVVDKDNVIIKGHGRRLACLKLGLKKVPVVKRTDLTKEEADAARLSDNRVVSSSYDIEGLQEELERLSGSFDFDTLGFDTRELNFSLDNIDIEGDFIDNISQSIDEYNEDTEEKLQEDTKISVAKALGFKEIDGNSSYYVSKFVEMARMKYGLELSSDNAFCMAIKDIVDKGEL